MHKHSKTMCGDRADERCNSASRGRQKAQILLDVTSLSMASQHAKQASRCRGSAKPQVCLHLPKTAVTATMASPSSTDYWSPWGKQCITGDQALNLLTPFLVSFPEAAQWCLCIFPQPAVLLSLTVSPFPHTSNAILDALERWWGGLSKKKSRFYSGDWGQKGLVKQLVGSISSLLTAHFRQNF